MCIDLVIYFKLEISNIIRDYFFSKVFVSKIMRKAKFKW